jgi:hypothetical protein
MNPIIIPNNFVNKSNDFYINFININSSFYSIKYYNNIIPIINKIKHNNNFINSNLIIQNFFYFLYKYVRNNDTTNPLDENDGGKPDGGFELINKDTNNGYGIYHCHLSKIDSSILLWYPTINRNKRFIQIDYLPKHPTDFGYEQYVKDIYYNNDGGYHIEKFQLFSELHHLLPDYLYENKILKFNEFTTVNKIL